MYRLLLILALVVFVSDSRSIPNHGNLHYAHQSYPRRWGRWCSNDFECGHGFCQSSVCQCHRGYITWRYGEICNYVQRTKLSAFLVSFFVGVFGVDWFVLSRGNARYIVAGVFKLIIGLGCCLGWPSVIFRISKKKSSFLMMSKIITSILTLTSFIWWLIDWIRILANVFYDGNGAPLQQWGSDNYDRLSYRVY